MSNSVSEQPGTVSPLPSISQSRFKRWLFAFGTYTFFGNTSFTSAIWMIYLAVHGYNPFVIGLLETLFHVAKLVAEIPTGIFADIVGRRKSLLIFCLLSALQGALFLYPTPPLMVLSFLLAGLGFAFRGGADTAMLWTISGHADPQGQAALFSKWYSRMFVISLIGEVLGTATGGFLGRIMELLPFVLQIFVALAGIIPLLFIPEQRFAGEHEERNSALLHLGKGLRLLTQKPRVLGVLLLNGFTESCWQTIYFYYQLYLHNQGSSLALVGVAVAGGMATSAFFTAIAPWVMRRVPNRVLIPLCVGMEVLGLVMMSTPWLVCSLIGYLIFFQASINILGPAANTYINEHSPEQQRVTILSFGTGVFSAAMIIMFPLFGAGVATMPYSTAFTWMFVALSMGSLAIWCLTRLLQHKGSAGKRA